MRQTVLVAGATGLMGTKISRALASRDCRLRLLVRRPERVDALRRLDAELVQGDVFDRPSLARACAGVDVVVSALAGLADVIVDGQTQLLEAAQAAGVKRFLPS